MAYMLQKENPLLLVGDSHFFAGVYKPNFVSASSADDNNLSRSIITHGLKRFFRLIGGHDLAQK